jgi:hypothetical protein
MQLNKKKPVWAPNESQRDLIKGFAAIGLTYKQMGTLLKVSETTLKHALSKDDSLRRLLEEGKDSASATVRNTAYKMATSGKSAAMTIFWLKTREKWFETVQLAGHDGGPVKSLNLTPEQMKSEIKRLSEANQICDDDDDDDKEF